MFRKLFYRGYISFNRRWIEVGDFIWSEDPETGDITLKEVEATFINKTDTLVFINVDEETIKTTEGHLFYVEGTGWIPASAPRR